jgi:hypothetical protein
LTKNHKNGGFDQECEEVTEQKNRKYRSMIQKHFTRAAREEYNEARRRRKKKDTKKEKEGIL